MNQKKEYNIAGAICGSIAEWYEFAAYGFCAVFFAPLFFPSHNPSVSIIAALGAFAAGFVMRPVGALIYGHFGDTRGRRKALAFSIILMGLPTLCMGLLPTYQTIGIWAPILLITVRLIQGLSVGGEFTGSSVFMYEHTTAKNHYIGAGLVFSAAFFGMMLASLAGSVLTFFLSPEQMQQFGWRIPFYLGVVVAFCGYYVRLRTAETHSFIVLETEGKIVHDPIIEVFKHDIKQMWQCFFSAWLAAIIVYLQFIFMPIYAHHYLAVPMKDALLKNSIGMFFLICCCIFFGWVADRIGFKKVMVTAGVLIFIVVWPLYAWLSGHPTALLPVLLIFGLLGGAFIGPVMGVLSALYRPEIRYTGLSFSYNLSFGIFGGTAALVSMSLIEKTGMTSILGVYVMLSALLGTITIARVRLPTFATPVVSDAAKPSKIS